jgi:FixJ family two-component response regulator
MMFEDKHRNRDIFPVKWILVVEDSIEMQAMLLNLLRKRYDSEGKMLASAVSTARHAGALLQDDILVSRLHCILLDHDLQWGTGSEVIELLKQKNITVPVCGISGIHGNNQHMKKIGATEGTNKLDFIGIWNFLDHVDKDLYPR